MSETIILYAINETITFVNRSKDTDGRFLEIVVSLPNKEAGPVLHYHPLQSKYFECIEGDLVIDLVHEQKILKPGEFYTVPSNTTHTCYPVGQQRAQFKIIYTPALNFEHIVSELFASANRSDSRHANLFDAGYILTQYPGEIFTHEYPNWFQVVAFWMLGTVGKLLGIVKAKPRGAY